MLVSTQIFLLAGQLPSKKSLLLPENQLQLLLNSRLASSEVISVRFSKYNARYQVIVLMKKKKKTVSLSKSSLDIKRFCEQVKFTKINSGVKFP